MSSGYSGTPLVRKLGYKPGFKVYVTGEPESYWAELGSLPDGVTCLKRLASDLDLVHFFSPDRSELEKALPKFYEKLAAAGMVWVSWPKKASKVPTTITEDVVREVALPLGFVDVKVCAVDEVWSGLKLVIRKELRGNR